MVCGISVISDAATLPSHTTIQIRPLIPAPMLPGAARTCPALPSGSSRLPLPSRRKLLNLPMDIQRRPWHHLAGSDRAHGEKGGQNGSKIPICGPQ